MRTKQLYLDDTYRYDASARITRIVNDDGIVKLTFDQTIFHPQGGGQPSNTGSIEIDGIKCAVVFVVVADGDISHTVERIRIDDISDGDAIRMTVDADRRQTSAKYHSAGHLISHVFETLNPNMLPGKGHHHPGAAYIEMADKAREGSAEMLAEANQAIQEALAAKLEFDTKFVSFEEVEEVRPDLANMIPKDAQTRALTIGQFNLLPCGGTHVRNAEELSGLEITRIKRKKDNLKVSYMFT